MIVPILVVYLLFVPVVAAAESNAIFISISDNMNKVIFDGKWTTPTEWKRSAWSELKFDDSTIQLRVAHQENFVYVFVDSVDDNTADANDNASICIDSKNNKSTFADDDDFCFKAKRGMLAGETYQGNNSESNPGFTLIANMAGFASAGGTSDENDRYIASPHTGYEFKIPTDMIGRSDNYGFFVSVFDESKQKYYDWPANATRNTEEIPSPQLWGDLISPDKSLPEFDLPLLVLLPSLVLVFYLTRIRKS